MRPCKKDRHLPPCVHQRHGAFYLVKRGKWEWLGKDLSGALAEYGRRLESPKGGMAEFIDEALAVLKPSLASTTWAQYQAAAQKLKPMLGEFAPQQVKPKDVTQVKRQVAQTPDMANGCLSVEQGRQGRRCGGCGPAGHGGHRSEEAGKGPDVAAGSHVGRHDRAVLAREGSAAG